MTNEIENTGELEELIKQLPENRQKEAVEAYLEIRDEEGYEKFVNTYKEFCTNAVKRKLTLDANGAELLIRSVLSTYVRDITVLIKRDGFNPEVSNEEYNGTLT